MTIETQAYGKLLLCGEHTVFHGSAAIGIPIPDFTLSLKTDIHTSTQDHSSIEFITEPTHNEKTKHKASDNTALVQFARYCEHAILSPMDTLHSTSYHYRMYIKKGFPIASGFGSSAALCVAIANVLHQYKEKAIQSTKEKREKNTEEDTRPEKQPKRQPERQPKQQPKQQPEMNKANITSVVHNDSLTTAHKLEHFFHGNSSGIDILLAAHDVPLLLEPRTSQPAKHTLDYKITTIQRSAIPPLLVGCTSRELPALESIRTTRQFFQKPPIRKPMIKAIQDIATCLSHPTINTTSILAEQFTLLQHYMNNAGLVTPTHKAIASTCMSQGALCFKTSGAGNGGAFFALCASRQQAYQLYNTLSKASYPVHTLLLL